MIRITEWKLPVETQGARFEAALRRELGISDLHPMTYRIVRRSIDARRPGRGSQESEERFYFVYTVDVDAAKEDKIWKKASPKQKMKWERMAAAPRYTAPKAPSRQPGARPVVVGLGPSGLFCALLLARAGLRPLVVERGNSVEARLKDTETFFSRGILDPDSNVQFGEGGAGAFSDGKLNTLIKDPTLRGHFVMEEFVKAGAPEEILYDAKPHVGTDRLQIVVKNMREELISLGADIRFRTKLTGIQLKETDGELKVDRILLKDLNAPSDTPEYSEEAGAVFLGIGHSARDTFKMLLDLGAHMEEKSFAMGVRIEHPREMIDRDQYRSYAGNPLLGSASYKLTYHAATGRSLYTFCMCPGGKVIASASEPETVVTNGMSNYARDEVNSNSALLVNVNPPDFAPYREEAGVLSGVLMQQKLEHRAYLLGGSNYHAPVQTVGDFLEHRSSSDASFGDVCPSYTGGYTPADLHEILPGFIADTLEEGLQRGGEFGRRIHGFDRPDAVLTGIESRSSSPVRIVRGEDMQSNLKGLYPMGEGAGYAGGITSAAIDGMKMAETYLNNLN